MEFPSDKDRKLLLGGYGWRGHALYPTRMEKHPLKVRRRGSAGGLLKRTCDASSSVISW
jgi:hypothetical protein